MKGEAKKRFVADRRKRYGEKGSRKAKSDIIADDERLKLIGISASTLERALATHRV